MSPTQARARLVIALIGICAGAVQAAAQRPAEADTALLAEMLVTLRDTSTAVRAATVAKLRARAAEVLPTLKQWASDPSSRRQHFAAAAIVRIGPPAYPVIRAALRDEELQFTYTNALHVIDSASTLLTLLEPLLVDADPAVRAGAVGGLEVYRDDAPLLTDAILRALNDADEEVRGAALALHLSQINSDGAQQRLAERLETFLDSPAQGERRAAAYTLGNMHPHGQSAIPKLLVLAEHDPDVTLRYLSARAVTWLGAEPQQAQPVLLRMLGDAADTVRYEALDAIGAIGLSGLDAKLADSIVDIVASYLDSPRESMREIASTSLARLGAPALERMILALQSPYEAVAVIATKGLAGLPELPEIDEPLLAALADSRDSVRASASLALVGPGARVEDRLRELARRGPGRGSGAAAAALALIESQRMLDVVDRCYRIEYGMWSPPLPFRTIEGVLPPQTLRFRSLVAYAPMERRPATFVLEQRWREGWVASGWWRPDSVTREVILDASPQLSGVRITVREAAAGELRGEARTYWDYRRETEAAPVRLVAIACSLDAGSGR